MKKLKRFWLNIPRKWRVCGNLLTIVFLVFFLYVLLECPAFTPELKFRRMEKAELVGPSQILTSMDQEAIGYDHLILAETAEAVILFQSSDNPWDQGRLTYREKTAPVTVMTVPGLYFWHPYEDPIDLPVFVFHDEPSAVRAELELEFGDGMKWYTEVNWQHGDTTTTTNYNKTWHLESDQELGGVFCFHIHAEPEVEKIYEYPSYYTRPLTSEGTALEVFSRMMDEGDSCIYAAIPAVVRLYDAEDTLLVEEELTIRSVAGDRYAREESVTE